MENEIETLDGLIEKGIVVLCDKCKGSGKTYGFGASGELDSYVCSSCKGQKYVLEEKNKNKDILSDSLLKRN